MSTQNDIECAICHDSNTQTEDGVATQYMTTECNHRFHHECLQEWFNQFATKVCPMCRTIVRCFDPNVTRLSIGNLTNLTSLDVSCYYIRTPLPESIGKLSNLEDFRLRSCTFLTSLPESFFTLTSIKFLDLSGNQFVKIPESIGNLINLTYLNLGGNKLVELP